MNNLPPLDLTRDENDECHCWLCEEVNERRRKRDEEWKRKQAETAKKETSDGQG